MSFNSRFKHIFGEIFQSEGFKYCSKLNVFAKMLNEDLLAFIGVKSAPIWNKGSKGFMITAGIISTYYDSIEKNSVLMIGHDLNLFLPKNEVRVSFEYDDNTMEEIISITALYVREHLLPVINQVFDFNSYIEYLKKYSIDLLWDCDSFKGESLILIKADNHDDFQPRRFRRCLLRNSHSRQSPSFYFIFIFNFHIVFILCFHFFTYLLTLMPVPLE